MESVTVVAFRMLVMLACLIVVPAAAIFGSAFPEVVKSLLVDRIMALAKPKAETSVGGEAPQFGSQTGLNDFHASPAAEAREAAPRWPGPASQSTATPSAAWPGGANNVAAGGVPVTNPSAPSAYNNAMPASFNSPAVTASPTEPGAVAAQPAGAAGPRGQAADSVPWPNPLATPSTGREMADSQAGSPGALLDAHQSATTASGAPAADRFTFLERRLREFGATYYLLETWGNEGELYRFHCKIAVANNANYTRQFEATDADALKAMGRVLEQVEAWRAGRLQ